MPTSPVLLTALSSWEVITVQARPLFHGCRADDFGIDVAWQQISGVKWFSARRGDACDYPWHVTREKSPAIPYVATVTLLPGLRAVVRPDDLTGKFLPLLATAFPKVQGYDLSREFQSTLLEHLQALHGPAVNAYAFSRDLEELLIPESGKWVESIAFEELPFNRDDYLLQRDGADDRPSNR